MSSLGEIGAVTLKELDEVLARIVAGMPRRLKADTKAKGDELLRLMKAWVAEGVALEHGVETKEGRTGDR